MHKQWLIISSATMGCLNELVICPTCVGRGSTESLAELIQWSHSHVCSLVLASRLGCLILFYMVFYEVPFLIQLSWLDPLYNIEAGIQESKRRSQQCLKGYTFMCCWVQHPFCHAPLPWPLRAWGQPIVKGSGKKPRFLMAVEHG